MYARAILKLDEYFSPQQNKVYERHLFRLLKHKNREKFERISIRLCHQIEKCQFINLEEQLIDQITEKCCLGGFKKEDLSCRENKYLEYDYSWRKFIEWKTKKIALDVQKRIMHCKKRNLSEILSKGAFCYILKRTFPSTDKFKDKQFLPSKRFRPSKRPSAAEVDRVE